MADDLVSSTTPLGEELDTDKLLDHAMGDFNEAVAKDVVNAEDIVDLVGGAQDAIERHIAEDIPKEITEIPETLEEPVLLSEPEPVAVVPEPEPEPIPEPEPVIAPPTVVEEVATEQPTIEEVIPDSTVAEKEPEPVIIPEPEPVPVIPEPVPEPEIIPEPVPEPIPEPVIAPVVEPPKAVPEEVLLPTPAPEKTAAAAPASYKPFLASAPSQLLMQFPAVVDLLYWRDVKTTGVVFGASLLLLLSLTVCSIVSVCSYVGLALLSVTISFRIYKGILQAIQKSDEGHPFKLYLDQEVTLSEDVVHNYSDMALDRLNKTVAGLRRLFLVEDLIDSLKFAVLMWILTYVGALFNGLTILILGLVGAFSAPIVYEKHQAQIDHYIALVNNQIKDVVAKIQAKVPGLKRKAE